MLFSVGRSGSSFLCVWGGSYLSQGYPTVHWAQLIKFGTWCLLEERLEKNRVFFPIPAFLLKKRKKVFGN